MPMLGAPCSSCCTPPSRCERICCSRETGYVGDCEAAGIFTHTVRIPDDYTLPVMLNITGSVNDDLLLNDESITTDLELDPGLTVILFGPLEGETRPYPDTLGCNGFNDPNNEPAPCCVGAHTIGSVEGPYQDTTHGGITFPWSEREFTVACRDTVGLGAGIDITICIDPDGEQENHGAPEITGSCGADACCIGQQCVTQDNCGRECNCEYTRPLVFSSCMGSGASGTAAIENGSVVSVALNEKGSGYARKGRVAPTVTATASGGTGAVLSVTLSQQTETLGDYPCIEAPYWIVESVSVTKGGSGYSPRAVVSFSVSDGGTAEYHAKAYAWVVVEEPRNATGIVYGSGSGAQLTPGWAEAPGWAQTIEQPGGINPPLCGKGGRMAYAVSSWSIQNGGSGYSVGDPLEVEFSSPADGEVSAYGQGVFEVSAVDANGSITSISISDGGVYAGPLTDRLGSVIVESCIQGGVGKYYKEDNSEPPYVAEVTASVEQEPPAGSGAEITVAVDEDPTSIDFGKIDSVSLGAGGSGYLGICVQENPLP
jgi:hypothetical protein